MLSKADRLAAFLGHNDMSRVSPSNMIAYKESMLRPETGFSHRNVKNHWADLRTLFKFGSENRGFVDPMTGLTFKYKRKGLKPRRSYTADEAKIILTAARQARPAIRWLQWLAAYTGSRIAEIAECTTYDVRQMGGGWALDILLDHRDPRATLKTEASHRTVPLHKPLIEEGFLGFVAEVHRDYGDGPLFPMIRPNRDGRRSTPASNAVSKWLRNTLRVTDPRIGPNHSWRHLFATVHRRLGTRQDIVDAILGHEGESGSVGRHYGEFEVAMYRDAINRMPKFSD
jgi:integrase